MKEHFTALRRGEKRKFRHEAFEAHAGICVFILMFWKARASIGALPHRDFAENAGMLLSGS